MLDSDGHEEEGPSPLPSSSATTQPSVKAPPSRATAGGREPVSPFMS